VSNHNEIRSYNGVEQRRNTSNTMTGKVPTISTNNILVHIIQTTGKVYT